MDCLIVAGEALSSFAIQCENWKDPNELSGTLKYAYSYNIKGDTTFFSTVNPVLPLGDPDADYNVTIIVRIENQFGAAVNYAMSVKVSHTHVSVAVA